MEELIFIEQADPICESCSNLLGAELAFWFAIAIRYEISDPWITVIGLYFKTLHLITDSSPNIMLQLAWSGFQFFMSFKPNKTFVDFHRQNISLYGQFLS